MLERSLVVAILALLVVATAGALPRHHREAESEDYQTMDPYTNFTANEVCFSDDQVFQKGDLVPNPGPCEECRCEPPSIVCNMVKCPVNTNGCRTIQRPNKCCPEYICECEYNGRSVNDGARIDTPEEPCQVCYCKGGDIMCNSVTCYTRDDCTPIVVAGQCCPKYENCPIRDINGINMDKNGVPNKTSNHGNNNKDMQPWLLTKTAEPVAIVTTENGDDVIVSDWLTERKLMDDWGSTTASLQREGGRGSIGKRGPVEEVIFTRVDTLRDNPGVDNRVTTIFPTMAESFRVTSLNSDSATSPPSTVDDTPITKTTNLKDKLEPSGDIMKLKNNMFSSLNVSDPVKNSSGKNIRLQVEPVLNENSYEQKTTTNNIKIDSLDLVTTEKNEINVDHIQEYIFKNYDVNMLLTVEPQSEIATDNSFATNGVESFEENTVTTDSNIDLSSEEFSTFYSKDENLSEASKDKQTFNYSQEDIHSETNDATTMVSLKRRLDPETRVTESPFGITITTNDLVESTTSQLLDGNDLSNYSGLSMTFYNDLESNDSIHIDTTTVNIGTTARVKTNTEEIEGILSSKYNSIKPIKVKQDTFSSDIPMTDREVEFNTGVSVSATKTKSSLKNDSPNNNNRTHLDTPSNTNQPDLKNIRGLNQSTNQDFKISIEEIVTKTNVTSDPKLADFERHPTTTDTSDESEVINSRTEAINEALKKEDQSLVKEEEETSSKIPPVIDLNGAVPLLQLGGSVISESVSDEFGETGTSVSVGEGNSAKQYGTESPINLYMSNFYTFSTVRNDGLQSTPSPLPLSALKTNNEKSLKVYTSKDIMSTHIPLTPGDLKTIAEFLINKKIKPVSKGNDSQVEENRWLKGNLTSEDKISSILSAANVSIGIMNYTDQSSKSNEPTTQPVKVDKYEKDDVFKGNSIFGKENNLINKTEYLHQKYLESLPSTKAHERAHSSQYLDSKQYILHSSEPTTYVTGLNKYVGREVFTPPTSSSPSVLVGYKQNISTINNNTNRVVSSITDSRNRKSKVIDPTVNDNTSAIRNLTQTKSAEEEKPEAAGSPFSFISSDFTDDEISSKGLQDPPLVL